MSVGRRRRERGTKPVTEPRQHVQFLLALVVEYFYISIPDDSVDLHDLGEFLRLQAEDFDGTGVDSDTEFGDNGPTEPAAKEDDQ